MASCWFGGLPADFEGGGGHGGELGVDGEDAVEFSIGEGGGYGSGDASEDSGSFSVYQQKTDLGIQRVVPSLPQRHVYNAVFLAE